MSNTSSTFTELDFQANKNSLINHLRSQARFKDYDFNGSDINVLIDLLSKNTEKIAFYTNMAIAESFMDSAQLKASVFSKAKLLNYTPRSKRSARARVRVAFTATGDTQPYIIQKGRSFNTLIKNQSYVFSVPETITCASANTSFSFETDVYEGVYVKDVYVFRSDEVTPYPRFKITNGDVDTTSLSVVVFENDSEIGETYKLSTTLLGLDERSKVFFLQASEDGKFEITFGDGVIGRAVLEGARIVLDYRITQADLANGAAVFSINFDPTGSETELTGSFDENPSVVTLSPASSGAPSETIESVRYYAPRAFQVQERATAATDYSILLKTNFPEINAVDTYGGEEEVPPLMRKIIVSVDVSDVEGLPDSRKRDYYAFLKERMTIGFEPIFRDPVFTYLRIDSIVRYNVNVTASSKELIKTLVEDAVSLYNEEFLDDFRTTLRYSQLVRAIDAADDSIISNVTAVQMYKKSTPTLGSPSVLNYDFGTALASGQIDEAGSNFGAETVMSSTAFTHRGERVMLQDDGEGKVFIVRSSGTGFSPVQEAGVINYDRGSISIRNVTFDDYDGSEFKVYVRPKDPDVVASRRNILSIEPSEVFITVQSLRV